MSSERAAQIRMELKSLEEEERQEELRLKQEKWKEIEQVWSAWQEQLRILQASHSVQNMTASSFLYQLKFHPYARARSQYELDGGLDNIVYSNSMSVASYASYRDAICEASPVVFEFVFDSHEKARASILPQDQHHRMLLTLYGVIYTISWRTTQCLVQKQTQKQKHSSKSKSKTLRDLLHETVQHLRTELDIIEQALCDQKFSTAHLACSNKALVRYFHRFTDDNVKEEDLEIAQRNIKELQNHPWSMVGTEACDQAVLEELSRVSKIMNMVRMQHLQIEPDNATIETFLQSLENESH